MSTTLYLVRHALKEKAVGDVPITKEGILQAEATARYFGQLHAPITAITASPLRRAQETAGYIAVETHAAVETDSRLRERANWGDLPGQSFEEFIAMWERCTREPAYLPPVGDSAKLAGQRMASVCVEMALKHPPDSHIVLVTHGGIITDFLVHTLAEQDLNRWHPEFIRLQSGLIPECSITRLNYAEGEFEMASFAMIEHL
ncbi:histidine phosphatase family protein [Paenibacillus sp. JX-17]|uniref:Histidine phosphatase family protein n=1 Tax=Paenibacillus lacisoli TaxID=3064525 RepID=A0ABT9CEG3_9BACL|nr:histidine phosphatase family protein [Paenibacillus sp. JX-17]MDO7907667.1 histidine phosphatase family protein [Paenibacillus sp. JX-17]